MSTTVHKQKGNKILKFAKSLYGDPHAEKMTLLIDTLADLMHACPKFDSALRIARSHVESEKEEPRKGAGMSYVIDQYAKDKSLPDTEGK